jgi:hypothetical protein
VRLGVAEEVAGAFRELITGSSKRDGHRRQDQPERNRVPRTQASPSQTAAKAMNTARAIASWMTFS